MHVAAPGERVMSKNNSKCGWHATAPKTNTGGVKPTVQKPITELMKTTPYSRQHGQSQGK
jgi:hypothetical protein